MHYLFGKEMAENKDYGILHYSNRTFCFLSNDDFDYMIAAKNAAEEAIGWKVLPENIVYRVEKMRPIQTKRGILYASFMCEILSNP